MSMVIRSNLDALRTYNLMNSNHSQLEKSLTNVATGMKINSAQDNSSAYAISEKMRVRIRALDQAYSNTQNASSMIKTAEGAANNILELVKTLKTKAIDSANDSNTDEDRRIMQKEFNQLIDEVEDSVHITFNGMRLIDNSRNNAMEVPYAIFKNYNLAKNINSNETTFSQLTNRFGETLGIKDGDTIRWSVVDDDGSRHGELKGNNTFRDLLRALNTEQMYAFTSFIGSNGVPYIDKFGKSYEDDGTLNLRVYDYMLMAGLTLNVTDNRGNVNNFANANLNAFTEVIGIETTKGDRALSFQVSSEANFATKFAMGDLRASTVGLKHYFTQNYLSISTKEDANLAIDVLDRVVTKVLNQQTSIGAFLERLEHTATNLTTMVTNDQASESTIRDADMAKEMTNYMKNNLLVQSSQAMLAQANQEPLDVMALLDNETVA